MNLNPATLKQLKYSELRLYIYLGYLSGWNSIWVTCRYQDIHDFIGIAAGTISETKDKLVAKGIIDWKGKKGMHWPSQWKVLK